MFLVHFVYNAFSGGTRLDCGGLSVLQQDTSEMARPFLFSLDEAAPEDDGTESHPLARV